ncbi:hypothetical protein CYMTET_8017 [Cymbomonas tetramitiformis]|uniref:Uncharacterized protein n=1 Tax=Cymbomonas tetramitiformis TaxID=36881 RepID=A0AAE0LGH8_9CHLO|nr:hypothetical protein CYMTET_8017 [Cymbomonas tetramitiformis]
MDDEIQFASGQTTASDYDLLKQKVFQAKTQQRRIQQERQDEYLAIKSLESEIEQKHAHETEVYEARLQEMKRAVGDANERACRMKAQLDKEKKAWSLKMERVIVKSENIEKSAKARVHELKAEHSEQLARQQEELERDRDEKVLQLEEELRACVLEVEEKEREWELSMQQHTSDRESKLAAQLQKAEGERDDWQRRSREAAELCEALREQLCVAQKTAASTVASSENEMAGMEERLAEEAEVVAALRKQNEALVQQTSAWEEQQQGLTAAFRASSKAAIREVKEKQAAELDAIHLRVKTLVSQKDKTIAELRAQVDATRKELAFTTRVLEQYQADLLEIA